MADLYRPTVRRTIPGGTMGIPSIPEPEPLERLVARGEQERLGLIEAERQGLIAPETPRGEFEYKWNRRQELIRKAAQHGVPPEELARQMKAEGVFDVQMPVPEEAKGPTAPKAASTIETAEGIMQWNPQTERYDIKVGMGKVKPAETKATIKAREAEKKAAKAEVTELQKAGIISSKAGKALEQTGFFTTGFIGNVLSAIPGTPAYDLDKTIDTIKANLGFEELRAMRAASPTGGALGQIAVRELEFLQRAQDALELGQSEEQLRDALVAIKTHYDNVIKAIKQGREQGLPTIGESEGEQPQTGDTSQMTTEELLAIARGE